MKVERLWLTSVPEVNRVICRVLFLPEYGLRKFYDVDFGGHFTQPGVETFERFIGNALFLREICPILTFPLTSTFWVGSSG